MFEVKFSFSFKNLRNFSSGPSTVRASTRLLITLLLNSSHGNSLSYYTVITSPYIGTLL